MTNEEAYAVVINDLKSGAKLIQENIDSAPPCRSGTEIEYRLTQPRARLEETNAIIKVLESIIEAQNKARSTNET